MASSKWTFAADTFAADTFACGLFRGVGVAAEALYWCLSTLDEWDALSVNQWNAMLTCITPPPYSIAAAEVFLPGATATEVFVAGGVKAEIYISGQVAGEAVPE